MSRENWPSLLQRKFRALGLNIEVVNLAIPATGSAFVVAHFDHFSDTLEQAHIVIVDNDGIDFRGGRHARTLHKELLSMLIGLPQAPAVLDFESFFTVSEVDGLFNTSRTTLGCPSSMGQYPHHAAQQVNVPMVSFPEAVCHSNRTWWILDHETRDMPWHKVLGIWDNHCGVVTHDLMARTVLGVVSLEMDGVCARGVSGKDFEKESEKLENPERRECFRHSLTYMHARRRRPGHFVPTAQNESVWHYGEDVLGKPGWIAEGAAGDIVFQVEMNEGRIEVDYLKTYENIGTLECWLDEPEPSEGNRCLIDALSTERFSSTQIAYMRTGAAPGVHSLRCRSDGRKFKLTSVASC